MNVHTTTRIELDPTAWKNREAKPGDVATWLTGPTTLLAGKEVLAVYDRLPGDCSDLVAAVERVQFPKQSYRTNGLKTNARGFGFTSRNIIRGDYCNAASLATEDAAAHEVVCRYATLVSEAYRRANAPLWSAHRSQTAATIDPAYRLQATLFTSGNINKNNPIVYHYDKGNFRDVWSGMIVLKRDCDGGHLVLPELGCGVELEHGSVFLFDGQGLLHGVTPFYFTGSKGFRYTVVYYSLQQVWKCLPPGEELRRIRRAKTRRERAVVGRNYYAGKKPELSKLARRREKGES